MRIYKSFFRFEKCRKACKYRLYRLMRTYKEIVKNYILIFHKYHKYSSLRRKGPCFVHYKYNKQKPGIARLFSILEVLTKWGEYFCAILRMCQIPLLFDTIIYDSSLITLNFRVAGRRETLREQWAQRDCACSGGNLPPLAARPFEVHLNL